MPKYQVTAPSGEKFEVTAPDGASQADVLAYAQKQFAAKKDVNPIVDAVRAIPGGLGKGIAGLGGMAGDLMNPSDTETVEGLGGEQITVKKGENRQGFPTSDQFNKVISAPTGGYYEPQTTAGRYTEKAASFAPAAIGGPGSFTQRALSRVLLPAAGAQGAGSLVDADDHPALHVGAEALGALAGGGLALGSSAIGKAYLATREAPEILAQRRLADLLAKQGVGTDTLTAASIPGRGQLAAEALGPQGVTMMATLGRRSGDTGKKLAEVLKQRATSAPSRILADAEEASGIAPSGAVERIKGIVEEGRERSRPLYNESEAWPANTSEHLERLAAQPDVRKGMAVGIRNDQRRAASDNVPFDSAAYAITKFDDAGDPIISAVPTWKTWDAGKRGLDEELEQFRNPTTRQLELTPTGYEIDYMRRKMLEEIDSLNPAYAKARKSSADYMSANSSFLQAQKHLMDPKSTAKQVDEYFVRLNDGDKEAYRAGLSNLLYQQAMNQRLRPGALLTPNIQSKIKTAFGQDKGARFIKSLEDEAELARTGGRMMPGTNSISSDVLMMSDDIDHMANFDAAQQGVSAIGNLLAGKPMAAIGSGLKAVGHFAPDLLRTRGMNESARNELGRLLMGAPDEMDAVLKALPAKPQLNVRKALAAELGKYGPK